MIKGEKPASIPLNVIPTQRDWNSYSNKVKKKNPIHEGQICLEYLEKNPSLSYKDAAKQFNIIKARVCQMIALIKKLPKEMFDYLSDENETLVFN